MVGVTHLPVTASPESMARDLRCIGGMVVALATIREPGRIVPLDPDSYTFGAVSRVTLPAHVRIRAARSVSPLPYTASGEEHLGRHVDVCV
jgi:hypothetical protein